MALLPGTRLGPYEIVQPAAEESAPLRFEIVLNWTEELKQRVRATP